MLKPDRLDEAALGSAPRISSGRRQLHRVLSAVVIAWGVAACQPEERMPAQQVVVDTAAARAAIDTLRAAYEAAVASGNFDNMGAMLAEGAVMVRPGGAQWDSFFAASPLPFPPGSTIDIEPIEVHVASHEWAYEFGNSTVSYTPQGSNEVRSLKDTYIVIFRNTGSGWKVYREVASSNLPAASNR